MIVINKKCIKCSEEKELNRENFNVKKGSVDGFRNECRDCTRAFQKEYREKRKDDLKEYHTKYYQENKEKFFDRHRKSYEKNRDEKINYARNYYQKNKENITQRDFEYRQKNKERKSTYDKFYRIKNREEIDTKRKVYLIKTRPLKRIANQRRRAKLKELAHDLTLQEWSETLIHFENKCCYCGEGDVNLTQDHLIPVSKDGGYTKDNILPSCPTCNFSKNNRDFETWYKSREFYSIERHEKILKFVEQNKQEVK